MSILQSLILCPPNEVEYYKRILTDILKAHSLKTSNIDNGCIIISEHSEDSFVKISKIPLHKAAELNNITWFVRNYDKYKSIHDIWYLVLNSRKEYPFLDTLVKIRQPTVTSGYVIVPKDKFFN